MNKRQINHQLYTAREFERTHWKGTRVVKPPTDLWAYQQIIAEAGVTTVIECGAGFGGSALYFHDLLERQPCGSNVKVISVSIPALPILQNAAGIEHIVGRSTDPDVVTEVARHVSADATVLVSLDSGHCASNVYAELRAYSQFVTAGSWLVVEDTNLNGNPEFAGNLKSRSIQAKEGGPKEALDRFMQDNDEFEVQPDPFIWTNNPGGWLKRKPCQIK